MSIEQGVTAHYTHGSLESVILDAMASAGKDIEGLDPDDLSGADEFHTGWRPATDELARELHLEAACASSTSARGSAALPAALPPTTAALSRASISRRNMSPSRRH